MNEMVRKRNEQLAKTVIKGLQSRNMSGYYAEDKDGCRRGACLVAGSSSVEGA